MKAELYVLNNVAVYLTAALQPDAVFRWVQIGLGILLTLLGIISKVIDWYRKAKQDGKITKEELKELINENKDDVIEIIKEAEVIINEAKEHTEK